MKTYELTYIISSEMTLEEVEAEAKKIESDIQQKEGRILKQSNPVARTFSYPIKKRASGFWGALEFQIEPEKMTELKETVAKDGKIMRHMVIIKEASQLKKERRIREKPSRVFEETKTETKAKFHEEKPKVELKDIEQELEEILGQ